MIETAATQSRAATPAPPPGRLVADRYANPRGFSSWRPQGTQDWLIMYTVAGTGYYGRGEHERCGAGDVVLLPPGTPHDYGTAGADAPWDFFWAHFLPRPHWLPWLHLFEPRRGVRTIAVDGPARARLTGAFTRLVREDRGVGTFYDDLALNALEEVLLVLARQQSASRRRLDPRVELVLARLGERLGEPLSVPELAAEVGLSPSRIAHMFKAQVGEPLMAMRTKLRLRHASRLLELTTHPVGEISQAVGYDSQFQFSRLFRAHYGCSPSAYRRQQRQPEACAADT